MNTQLVRSSGLPVCYIAMTSMLLSRRAVDCQHVAANESMTDDQQVDTSKSLAADCETNRQSPRNDTLPVRIVAIVLVSSRSNNNNKPVGDWFARS